MNGGVEWWTKGYSRLLWPVLLQLLQVNHESHNTIIMQQYTDLKIVFGVFVGFVGSIGTPDMVQVCCKIVV